MATRFDIEAMIRGMQEEIRKKQIASGQMTLGAFITALESMPREMPVRFDVGSIPGKPDSYRGYYEQLAFSYDGTPGETVGGVLVSAQGAMGRGFTGYKGGDYIMHENTLVWGGSYGTSSDGRKIMAIECDGECAVIRTAEDEF